MQKQQQKQQQQQKQIEKPQTDRITECLVLLQKLAELGVTSENPSVRVLKKRMAQYWREGLKEEGSIPLVGSNRSMMYTFPKWSHQFVDVTLRVNKLTPTYPPDLVAEIEGLEQ